MKNHGKVRARSTDLPATAMTQTSMSSKSNVRAERLRKVGPSRFGAGERTLQ